ncbi:caspase family protein [Litorisediminicola beolgyonensis]|uniref:Caspase family protein n=1 Tax=Litorisediminicola beolgyonensis TaxID=1173614 RepID=A0ABW3ZLP6_9RHOB
MRAFLRLILVAGILLGMAGVGLAQDRVALVIGNSDYASVGSLKNPQNDALDISVALEGLGFKVYFGRNLSRARMLQAADQFTEAVAGADVALFYYAGHGFQVDGRNYLLPTDAAIARAADVSDQTVPVQAILQAMNAAKGIKLVFLDACRDNPFGAVLQDDPAVGSGLARIGNEADFLFSYATQPDNVAYDGTGRNSFFTEALLHHLYTPGQNISDLLISVRRDVMAATGGKQIPYENLSLTRQFVFDTSAETVSQETLLYQVATSVKDPVLLKLYVDTYPQGSHVGEALASLETGTATRSLTPTDPGEEEEQLWQLARRSRLRPLLEYYVERYPEGTHATEAARLIALIPPLSDASPGALCERLATHPRDATAGNAGVPFARLQDNAVSAIRACSAAVTQSPDLPHYVALLARATASSGDLARAISLYQTAAGAGDLRAMVSLAQLMENGTGMTQDIPGALALYEAAANAGSHDAMINLAITLFEGTLLPQDTDRAVALLRRAARDGSAKATFNLGVLAQEGRVGDPSEALDYFRRAARDGEHEGYRAAAILLDEGRGVDRNPEEAAIELLRGVAEDSGAILTHLTERTGEWSRDTIAQVQLRLAAAGYYTSTVDGLPGPNFTVALTRWRNGGFDAGVLSR